MWEVFNPYDGRAKYRVPWRWLARLIAHTLHHRHEGGLDYERAGEGWVR